MLALAACRPGRGPNAVDRLLFFGNSLTLRNDLPGVFDAVSGRTSSTTLARNGARLADHAADPEVIAALDSRRFDSVILQERGGDLTGGFGSDALMQSRIALRTLIERARAADASPLLLGSYQRLPASSRRLVEAEREVAQERGVPAIIVSDALQVGLEQHPRFAWFAADGMHPGPALTLLMAVLIHRALYGSWPTATAPEEKRGPARADPHTLRQLVDVAQAAERA